MRPRIASPSWWEGATGATPAPGWQTPAPRTSSRNSFSLTIGISPTRRKIRFALLIFAVALLIIALARPQYGFDLQEVEQRGLDIVVAVDTSKSMLTTDIAP